MGTNMVRTHSSFLLAVLRRLHTHHKTCIRSMALVCGFHPLLTVISKACTKYLHLNNVNCMNFHSRGSWLIWNRFRNFFLNRTCCYPPTHHHPRDYCPSVTVGVFNIYIYIILIHWCITGEHITCFYKNDKLVKSAQRFTLHHIKFEKNLVSY